MKRLAFLVGLTVAALGCGSTYDNTYQQETQRLEAQERARQDAEMAKQQQAYDEASRYAAVVYFPLGSSVIDERGYQELTWFAQKIAGAPANSQIQVQGFADATGGETRNQELSEKRAYAVADFLTQQGIARDRLLVQGFSENFAAQPNETTEGRRNNRRVEVTLK